MNNYKNKYLKYKNKYLELKNLIGGECNCEIAYKNVLGTCWAVAIQTIFSAGEVTNSQLESIIKSIPNGDEWLFIKSRIIEVLKKYQLTDIFTKDIFLSPKRDHLELLLYKFIDRYKNKVLNTKLGIKGKISILEFNDLKNPFRCELSIVENFKYIFNYPILNGYGLGGMLIDQYLFSNLLSVFFFGYKVSFRNYYTNFNLINFDKENDLGILILIKSHLCCLYICCGEEKYYNDWDKKVYNCKWLDLLKMTNNLYVEENFPLRLVDYDTYNQKEKLNKVLCLTVVSKYIKDNLLDKDIIKAIKITKSYNSSIKPVIKDQDLQFWIGYQLYKHTDNKDEGIKYLHLSLDQGYTISADYIHKAMDDGYDVKQGHPLYQHNLGMMYENGFSVGRDNYTAFYYYELASAQGYAKAQNNLGRMYEKGLGILLKMRLKRL